MKLRALMTILCIQLRLSCPALASDGFNIYKDLLIRNKVDEPELMEEDLSEGPRMYFYRAPSYVFTPSYTSHPADLPAELGKRANHFKSFMLSPNREANEEEEEKPVSEGHIYHFPRVAVKREASPPLQAEARTKRVPGSILSWALYSKHLPDYKNDHSFFLSPLLDTTRQPSGDKSSAFVAKMGKRSP